MADSFPYLIAVSRTGELLKAIQNAQAPERFTVKFLEDLGYKSTNDRLFIGFLKALKFLDSNGIPTQRYFKYLDVNESKFTLAEGIRDAYDELFKVNKEAHKLNKADLTGKLKSLTQGKLSKSVLDSIARTFAEVVKLAEFTVYPPVLNPVDNHNESEDKKQVEDEKAKPSGADRHKKPHGESRLIDSLNYRIEIVLPPSRDKAVYDAIFRSLKEHLL